MKKRILALISLSLCMALGLFAQTTTTTTQSLDLPDNIRPLMSMTELASEALFRARELRVNIRSSKSVGSPPQGSTFWPEAATEQTIQKAVSLMDLKIKLSGPDYVSYNAEVLDENGVTLLRANNYQYAWADGDGKLTLPKFEPEFELSNEMFIKQKNIWWAKVTTFYGNSDNVKGTWYLNTDQGKGLYFPSILAGRVLLEIMLMDGTVTVYDLRKGAIVIPQNLAVEATASIKNVVSVVGVKDINLIPISEDGAGLNILGEITLFTETTISVAGQTTEGAKAKSFKYRLVKAASPLFTRDLDIGSTGSDVTELQKILGIPATGYFGPVSGASVRAYQASKGISISGQVGPLTRAALNGPIVTPDGVWKQESADGNGILSIKLPAGTWHIFGVYEPEEFLPNEFVDGYPAKG